MKSKFLMNCFSYKKVVKITKARSFVEKTDDFVLHESFEKYVECNDEQKTQKIQGKRKRCQKHEG